MFRHHTKGKQMCMCNFGIIPRKREHVAKEKELSWHAQW
ncbi:hypothetical protein SORBI_3004G065850 [Sorghum bicolor]|uniref:Uncharacterized protein n=1 Tax=Sorghum bicolor TaxID=4558 RepID=A0A1Z5RM12_SORBI|nr:hypothetical protein SORBI_3004G065850 [Sorghum bicolor]